MKLTVEIVDDKVEYTYEVGSSKQTAKSEFSAHWLECFTDLLRLCTKAWSFTTDQRYDRIRIEPLKELEKKNPPSPEGA